MGAQPFRLLSPQAGTIAAQDYDAEDSDEYMSLTSDVSERQDEIDNCDIHSLHRFCTCKQLGIRKCDIHKKRRYCTCSLGTAPKNKEDDPEVMLDLAGGEPAEMPQPCATMQGDDYFTRSRAI